MKGIFSNIAVSLLTAALLFGTYPAYAAATSSLGNNISSIEDMVNELVNIRQDQSIPSDTKLAEEIATQRDILSQIVALSENEIITLQDRLNNLPAFDTSSRQYSLQSNYLAELGSYKEYFNEESTVITDAQTLPQLQTVAAEMKGFRDAGYNNEVANIEAFSLLYYNQNIISTAKARLNNVGKDLTQLENADLLINTQVIDSAFGIASKLINQASELNNLASSTILQALPGGTSSTTTTTPNMGSATTTNPLVLIEQSINDIKDAYQLFISIGKSIKTQLE